MKQGFHTNIIKKTSNNDDFRHVLYTANHMQLVLMSLKPGQDIGAEVHGNHDQFFRFESGEGEVMINHETYHVTSGDVIIVPAGAQHNVTNTSSDTPLQLYTIYAPPHHADGTVRSTKEEAEASEPHFDGETSE